MPAFTSPSILFLSTWEEPERVFANELLRRLRTAGFSRYAEPLAGGFALSRVARAAGYRAEELETSDVGLFACALGSLFSGRDLRELDVRVDDELYELDDDPLEATAQLLVLQLELRLAMRPDVHYWNELREDLERRRRSHLNAIRGKLNGMYRELGGIAFEPLSMTEHLDRLAEAPDVVANVNPPSYMGAYERFFNTGGRLTWNQPEYDVFDPASDWERMYERYKDAGFLLLAQLQRPVGECPWPRPFYARPQGYDGGGVNTYYVANRPEAVLELIGGQPVAKPRVYQAARRLNVEILDYAEELPEAPKIELASVTAAQARYYKQLWMHRGIGWSDGDANFAMLIDGKLAGVGGYSGDTIVNSYAESSLNAVLLRYATGAPHAEHRLTRLIAKLALQRDTIGVAFGQKGVGPLVMACAERVITAEMTRHPEQKNQRGLMKLHSRRRENGRYHLIYSAPIEDLSPEQVIAFWRKKEAVWRANRKSSASPTS